MQELTLYFNERCLQADAPGNASQIIGDWITVVEAIIGLRREMQSDCKLGFVQGDWMADSWGIPFGERVRQQLGSSRDRWRHIASKIKALTPLVNTDQSLREIVWENDTAIGMTAADMAAQIWRHGWVMSLSTDNKAWAKTTIAAHRHRIDESGQMHEEECLVENIAALEHVQHWRHDLYDWGATLAQSGVLDEVAGNRVVMYSAPLEHNPPHVHLLEGKQGNRTYAKYLIETGFRETGKPTFDREMKAWLATYKDQLLRSWHRCQRELHPFQLEKVK